MEHIKRQDNGMYDYPPSDSWWWSSAGIAVRYSIVIGLMVLIFGYFLGGYIHARHRMRKGLEPLAYHRWMVRRQIYYGAQPQYGQQPYYNATNDAWSGAVPLHAAPPPAYNSGQAPPPVYEPATSGGKIAADQHYTTPVHRAGESSSAVPTLSTQPPVRE